MTSSTLLELIVSGVVALPVAFVLGIILLIKRRWRGALVCVLAGFVSLMSCAGLGVWLGGRGAHREWSKLWASYEKGVAERAAAQLAKINARKALVDPALLASVPEDFFTYDGFRDWWRLPLVFPYDLVMIDTLDSANLTRFKGGDVQDPNHSSEQLQGPQDITRFSFDRHFLIGRRGPVWWDKNRPLDWFIFEFRTEKLTIYSSESDMLQAAVAGGFTGDPGLKSVRERMDEYW